MTTIEPSTATIEYTVLGIPRPQGSMRPIPKKNGGTFMKSPDTLYEWRGKVTAATLAARTGSPLLGPLIFTATFVFQRPAKHYGTGRNRGTLKSWAPAYPYSKPSPDGDKLERATWDGITDAGTIWRDDVQVVEWRGRKRWGDTPCCIIRITEVV